MDGQFKHAMSFQCQWVMIQAKVASHGKDGIKISLPKTANKAME
jgi:hypothetical protein